MTRRLISQLPSTVLLLLALTSVANIGLGTPLNDRIPNVAEPEYPLAATNATVRVTVVFVGQLSPADARAIVIRRPNDGGSPLLLLRQNGATDADLSQGLKAAAIAAERYGPAPASEHRVSIRARASGAQQGRVLPSATRVRDLLESSSVRTIEGFGEVSTIDVFAELPGAQK